MKETILITQTQAVELIRSFCGATFIAFRAMTEAQASKAKNAKIVLKASNIHATAEWNYENSVNNQLNREESENSGSFVAKPRKWGVHESLSLVWHKGKAYLHAKVNKALQSPVYFVNGEPVSKSEVSHLLRKSRKPSTQTAVGVKKEIVCRDYALSSIRELRVNGKKYLIDHSQPAQAPNL